MSGEFNVSPPPGSGAGVPSDTVTGPDAYATPSDPGASTKYSRGDHDHGLPPAAGLVASVDNLKLTTTNPTVALTHTPSANARFLVNLYLRTTVAPTVVTVTVAWTDAGGAQTYDALAAATLPVGASGLPSFMVPDTATHALSITVTAGTANQVFVSASFEAA